MRNAGSLAAVERERERERERVYFYSTQNLPFRPHVIL